MKPIWFGDKEQRKPGASTTIITSPKQFGMVMDVDHDHQPVELLPLMAGMDIVLVEGFKQADLPKIEAFRAENGKPPACKGDPNLVAVASRTPLNWGVPCFMPDDFDGIADWICRRFALRMSNDAACRQAAC